MFNNLFLQQTKILTEVQSCVKYVINIIIHAIGRIDKILIRTYGLLIRTYGLLIRTYGLPFRTYGLGAQSLIITSSWCALDAPRGN